MSRKHIAVCPIAALLLLAAACSNQPGEPPAAEENGKSTAPLPAESGLKPLKPGETWEIYMLQGKRIGYGRTTVKNVTGPGGETVLSANEIHLKILRDGDVSEQSISIVALETQNGDLISYQFDMQMGPGMIRSKGKVEGDKMVIETTGPGSPAPAKTTLPWSPCYLGPFAVERSLLHNPVKSGGIRTFQAIAPEANLIADISLTADKYETVKLLDGERKLFRVEMTVKHPASGYAPKTTLWCDRSGDILKRSVELNEQLTLVSYRVSKAEALRKSDAAELDLMPSMTVKADRPIINPHQTKRARYRVTLKGGDPAEAFPAGATQSIEPIDPHTAEITVHAIRPGEKGGNPNAKAEKPAEADLASNIFIQSDDELIRANAEKAAGGEADPWRVAVALQRFVNHDIENVDYTQAFATAAEVARSRRGDCTEHAVYLAALCRARGIPARVAIGLVYMEGARAFGFHAWTEAFIDGRWTPIDGTLDQEGIGAAHLKIGSNNLKDASIAVALEPVLKLIGGLRIEVLETTPGE